MSGITPWAELPRPPLLWAGTRVSHNFRNDSSMADQFNIYTTYYESFLALSVSIRVDEHQLMTEVHSSAPELRYRDITFTTCRLPKGFSNEFLKIQMFNVSMNVARVRLGALPLIEMDFIDEYYLELFCKSMSNGKLNGLIIRSAFAQEKCWDD